MSVMLNYLSVQPGGFIGIKVLATVTVAVALVLAVLAAFLCLSRNKQNCNCKGKYKAMQQLNNDNYNPVLQWD